MRIFDLSHEIYDGMDVYPGDPEVIITETHNIKDNGYEVWNYSWGSHNSTHIDAQSHMFLDGKTLSDYSIDRFIAKALHIKDKDELTSGYGAYIINGPRFNDLFINRLIDLSPNMVGFKSDNDLNEAGVRRFLENDILPVGPLNLPEDLPDEFQFQALPLRITRGNGSPVRAIAITYD